MTPIEIKMIKNRLMCLCFENDRSGDMNAPVRMYDNIEMKTNKKLELDI